MTRKMRELKDVHSNVAHSKTHRSPLVKNKGDHRMENEMGQK